MIFENTDLIGVFMDIKTILISLILINYAMAVFIYTIKKTQPTFNGINYWIVANLAIGTGYFMLALRNQIPDFFSIVFANVLFVWAGLLRIVGLSYFFENKLRSYQWILTYVGVILYTVLFFYFLYIYNSQFVRTVLAGAVLAAISAITAFQIIKNREHNANAYYFAAGAFLIFSLIFTTRILTWIFVPSIRNLFASSFVNNLQFMSSMIIDIMWATMFFVIHNQKLTRKLDSSRKQYQMLFEHMNHAFVLGKIKPEEKASQDFEIVLSNKAFANFFNLNETEIVGKQISQIALTHDAEMTKKYCSVAQTGQPLILEYYSKIIQRFLKVNAYCPEPNYVAIVIEDIHDKKNAENTLNESEAKYRLLAENLSDVIWTFDGKTRKINYISPSVFELTGFTAAEIISGEYKKHLSLKDDFVKVKEAFYKGVAKLLETPSQITVYRAELHIPTKSGKNVWIEIDIKLMPDEFNQSPQIIGIARQIEHRKLIENELQLNAEKLNLANKDKDRFIAVLAHDLRSPFSVLINYSEMLLQNLTTYPTAKIETLLGYIKKTTRATYNLLEDILLWNSTKTGTQPFNPQWFEFGENCKNIIHGLNYVCESKDITITYAENKPAVVFADSRMINVIIRNLLLNAVKFSPPASKVNLSVHIENEMLTVKISDSGVGIAPANLATLWDSGVTKSTTGTAGERGSGFGLMICKDFIEKHQGKIWAESEVGIGSDFYFSISLKNEQ